MPPHWNRPYYSTPLVRDFVKTPGTWSHYTRYMATNVFWLAFNTDIIKNSITFAKMH